MWIPTYLNSLKTPNWPCLPVETTTIFIYLFLPVEGCHLHKVGIFSDFQSLTPIEEALTDNLYNLEAISITKEDNLTTETVYYKVDFNFYEIQAYL